MQPEEIVRNVIASARLEGQTLDTDTVEVVRKIAHGEMTDDEIEKWIADKVREIRSEDARERLKLDYLPVNFDFDHIGEYESYLSMTDDEQKAFISGMDNAEVELWISLETARALYIDPVDRNPASITEDKVARHPDRYA